MILISCARLAWLVCINVVSLVSISSSNSIVNDIQRTANDVLTRPLVDIQPTANNVPHNRPIIDIQPSTNNILARPIVENLKVKDLVDSKINKLLRRFGAGGAPNDTYTLRSSSEINSDIQQDPKVADKKGQVNISFFMMGIGTPPPRPIPYGGFLPADWSIQPPLTLEDFTQVRGSPFGNRLWPSPPFPYYVTRSPPPPYGSVYVEYPRGLEQFPGAYVGGYGPGQYYNENYEINSRTRIF